MSGRIDLTADGSKTVYSERFGEHYHSKFGAINEAMHVFIGAGYLEIPAKEVVSVLEIGFGTGLNALLTLQYAEKLRQFTYYETIELFPVEEIIVREFSDDENFQKLHSAAWESLVEITPYFNLHKRQSDLLRTVFSRSYDVVYFDAFSPTTQPEMWSREVFMNLYSAMTPGAIMTTYCAKSDVRRCLQSIGFEVERMKGPPSGKREMLRARKL